MAEVDVWTVSIMLRTEGGQTRAEASLLGRAVEVECSGLAGRCTSTVTGRPPSSTAAGNVPARAAAASARSIAWIATPRRVGSTFT